MPAAWSAKDERQYKHILKSCVKRGRKPKRCKSIAAATVNKQRAEEGRTLEASPAGEGSIWLAAGIAAGVAAAIVAGRRLQA